VYVFTDGKPLEKMIRTGLSDGQKTEVLEGVEEGEAVIIGLGSSKGNSASGSPRLRL
jgi:hypothetical protein